MFHNVKNLMTTVWRKKGGKDDIVKRKKCNPNINEFMKVR